MDAPATTNLYESWIACHSNILAWQSDGSGWFEPPEPATAIELMIVFLFPIFDGLGERR
jgi:hypothetical protein